METHLRVHTSAVHLNTTLILFLHWRIVCMLLYKAQSWAQVIWTYEASHIELQFVHMRAKACAIPIQSLVRVRQR